MSGLNGINAFGSLTSKVTGQKISFEDLKKFDVDGNGEISSSELNSAKKELKLDSLNFKTINANGDKSITEEEFNLLEQKVAIQDAVNEKLQEVYDNPTLKKYLTDIKNELNIFMNSYISGYTDEVSAMADGFKTQLETKFNEIKENKLANDPDIILDKVLDEMHVSMSAEKDSAGNTYSATEVQVVLEGMEKVARTFVSSYTGNNLKADLQAYLTEYFSQSDAAKLKTSADNFNAQVSNFGGYYSSTDFKEIKEAAKVFLNDAVDKGVVVKLGKINVASKSAVATALAQYTEARTLLEDMQKAISSLSSEPKKTELIKKARIKLDQEEYKKLAEIAGSSYQINAGLLDYSKIPGYASNEGICQTKKEGKYGSRDDAAQWLQDHLKEQCWQQISEMLTKKGVSPEKVRTVFENAFSAAAIEAAELSVDGEHSTMFRHSKSWTHSKTLTDNFISSFNQKIASAIDEMNASYTDLDVQDMDFTVINNTQDEEGNDLGAVKDADGNIVEGLSDAYKNGTVLSVSKKGDDYFATVADQIINGLRRQLLNKAKAMCNANGVTFDAAKFNAMFNSAKVNSIVKAVTGRDGEQINIASLNTTGAVGIGAGAAAGAATAVGVAGYGIAGATIATGALSVLTGGIGLAAVGIGALIGGLFGSKPSQSNLDVRLLVDSFTEEFKNSYTQWVETEKSEAKKS